MLDGYCEEYAPLSRNVMNYQMRSMPNLLLHTESPKNEIVGTMLTFKLISESEQAIALNIP